MAYSFVAAAVVSLVWVVVGYSSTLVKVMPLLVAYDKVMLAGIGTDALSGSIPEILFVIFQMTFAIITVAIISRSIAEKNEVWCLCCLYRDLGGRGLCTDYPLGMGWS